MAGIQDFIKQLQDEDFQSTVKFSDEPPVHTQVEVEKPKAKKPEKKTIKLNINKVDKKEEVENTPVEQPKTKEDFRVKEKPKEIASNELSEEELFIKSETSLSKKSVWIEYYNKAKNSKKDNAVTDKLKRGRFRILDDGSFIILPDLDTYQKSSTTLLEESWF
mgnify:CR=1 FL=1